ncbi:MAG: FAD-dependent oxidoreductase [Planctomycetaceae bacterium]|nr:FAD-dependent oxidoreductase [Planctomycetaceae bacterium]
MSKFQISLACWYLFVSSIGWAESRTIDADLLIVGGTESGCAAAVQAARMGVQKIVLVNDIEWLGGQFSAESLVAIDENTNIGGVRHQQPIPRHGAFKEIIDRIEENNLKTYGVARPGNTRVITTTRPGDAARVFREWLQPYVDSGQLELLSWYEPAAVTIDRDRVREVHFTHTKSTDSLLVRAQTTIDASDWGDVIRQSGAEYKFGPDLKSKYGEPLAPERRDGYPLTDMNPITYSMLIIETDTHEPIPVPANYDPRNYREHRWPKDPLWLYETRRVVDHYHFPQIHHPDVLLLCFPAIDYPLDVYPAAVAEALEKTELGASRKNIVQLTPQQRQIIFEDAKKYSLGFLHYLQTEVHDEMPDQTHSYRRFRLTEEFGTPDQLPWKPYVRESLRLKAMYMMRQQDTLGVDGDSNNFATAMYHDNVAVWQFEYDFHPTKREFLTEDAPAGPWRCGFREGRTWGPPYSGRSTFPVRSLVPQKLNGLIGAQKNLGYSSIVSAAVRLHDASMAIGQASGACAATAILEGREVREIPFDRDLLMSVQRALCDTGHPPAMIWPFRDLKPNHPAFGAINMLASTGCLPIHANEFDFHPDDPATEQWQQHVLERTKTQLTSTISIRTNQDVTRGEFARTVWDVARSAKWRPFVRSTPTDSDADGFADVDDALPLDPENTSLPLLPPDPATDGLPSEFPKGQTLVAQFNFCGEGAPTVPGFQADTGAVFDEHQGHGWSRSLENSHRQRGKTAPLADTFLFTRSHDVWEYQLPNGRYLVAFAIGDSDHEQFGQNVTVEGVPVVRDVATPRGRFAEHRVEVDIRDGRLTLEIGLPGRSTNTCLNWVTIFRP